MKMNKMFEDYLDNLFPNPKCELVYKNDYELLIVVVLSAQTTDKRVNSISPVLFNKYSTLLALSNASLSDLEDIIRPLGSFRKKAVYIKDIANILIKKYNGIVPKNRNLLISLPGVGRKTANVFLSEYYNYPAISVDTHVERVSKRVGLVDLNDNVIEIEKKLMKCFSKSVWGRRHLQMVLFGRYYCRAINPLCDNCPFSSICKK